ncbi:MAG: magnesium and cobalt transport protein CorA [Actinomycetota bacterium]
MITATLYRDGRRTDEPVDLDSCARLAAEPGTFLWLDVTAPAEGDLERLASQFAVHPLTVEDMVKGRQRTKIELFQDYTFIVLRPVRVSEDGEISDTELHALAGEGYLVTLRFDASIRYDEVVRRWERQPELQSAGFAVYVLIDEVVDGYLTAIERLEDLVDEAEDLVFGEHDGEGEAPGTQERLFHLKRAVVRLRRFAMPLRQGVDLVQEQPSLASPALTPYFRDVMDHSLRVLELADNIRDVLTSLLEVRVAQAANRLNEVMKKLTGWAAIVLVPTLIAGIYGMNFKEMPELGWGLGYPFALLLMAGSSLALYLVFKKRDWL